MVLTITIATRDMNELDFHVAALKFKEMINFITVCLILTT